MDSQPQDSTEVFKRFDSYNFSGDDEFQAGLASILAANSRTSSEVIQMAKVFYYSKSVEPIDYNDYMAWKKPIQPLSANQIEAALQCEDLTRDTTPSAVQALTNGLNNDHCTTIAADTSSETPYPATFAEIVELIKSGKPVPGIKVIPDKIAEGDMSVSTATPRAKPWESTGTTQDVNFFDTPNTTTSSAEHDQTSIAA